MAKLSVKVGEYEQDGKMKGRYVALGVLKEANGGYYALLDPTINLAGVLAKQNNLGAKQGKEARDMVMCSVFSDDQAQQQGQPQQQKQSNGGAPFDDNIPF